MSGTQRRFSPIGTQIGKIDRSTALANGDLLVYNSTTGKWVNTQVSAIPGFTEAAQDAAGSLLTDSTEIDFTYNDGANTLTAALITASITYSKLNNGSANSVVGRASNTSGVLADIVAGTNDRLLAQTGGALSFVQLTAGMFPNTVIPDAALSTNVPLLNAANTFTATGTALPAVAISAAIPVFQLNETDAAADNRRWLFYANSEQLIFSIRNDANTAESAWLTLDRTGTTVDLLSIAVGTFTIASSGVVKRTGATETRLVSDGAFLSFYNTADSIRSGYLNINAGSNSALLIQVNQGLDFYTNNTLRFGFEAGGTIVVTQATTGAQTATFSATNKPGSGTAGPTAWLPVKQGATTYYIPMFGA